MSDEQPKKPDPNAVTPAELKMLTQYMHSMRRVSEELFADNTSYGYIEGKTKSQIANALRKVLKAQGVEGLPEPHVLKE